ncbi:MAG: electron transfer flavoprotein subunit beta/FixA family protein [Nitrososphaerota archaeon]|nr:electron transfer flavoprotein subunit beta/FixA family protein [Nitrososphaerota archaeon]MDG6967395.1 electron transfer flavoprotein subunit beta/FixA family protein [Nitrososphaerota archaeon]MDG6977826.1 electron transfer flavoprotein subunit beta/FixA family protein [Nitrososphaerota archaeon]
MNIVVLAKSAIDEAELRADAQGHPVVKGAATKLSSFDMNGVEEAVRQKEASRGTLTVVSLGGQEAKKAIKEAMAMGCTRGLHIVTEPDDAPDSLATAFCLAQAVRRLAPVDLVVCSEGASDTYQGQVGAMVAEFLEMPFLANARKLDASGGAATCEQGFEGGVRIVKARLPAVVSMVAEANVPRYPTLIQVMVAGKKPIEDVPFSSLKGADFPSTGTRVLDVSVQASERKRVILDGTPEEAARKLAEALGREGVL